MPVRTQKGRLVAVGTPLGEDVLLLRRFTGSEQMGRMFNYQLDMVSEEPDLKFEDLIGQNISVRLELLDGSTRYFNGFVARFVQAGVGERLTPYRATVVPWLWFLTRVADCRIFQGMTAPDIIKQVFRDRGFSDFDDSGLSGTYREWEYCVQYRESDFNFVSRLMEQEGIYYYFKHEDGKHTLMLADSPSAHSQLPGYENLPFRPPSKSRFEYETVSGWTLDKQVQTGVVALSDFNFTDPKAPQEAKAAISREHSVPDLEVFDYPGEYTTASEGEQYARIRIEEFQTQYETVTGSTDARGIAPGFRLKVIDHPREDQNREYLITGVEFTIESDDFESGGNNNSNGNGKGGGDKKDFECVFTAIDAQASFRAGRITAKPMIRGPQTAIVVGKSGEEIWTDEHGRVKVQFHWDRYSAADENSSCWIRVAQNWAGKKWGAMFLPRIGQEVIVEFLEGDPDRPIITGRVYNGDNKSPYDLPANATMSTMKSSTSKGGAGFNEIRFEDKKDKEQIFIHAERRLDLRVKGSAFTTVGGKDNLKVAGDALRHIAGDSHEIVDGAHKESVAGNHHLGVGGDHISEIGGTLSLTVTGGIALVTDAGFYQEIGSDYHVKCADVVLEATSTITLKCGGSSVVLSPSGVTITGSTVTVDGSTVKIASGPGDSPGSHAGAGTLDLEDPDEAAAATTADPGEVSEPPPAKNNNNGPPVLRPTPVPNNNNNNNNGGEPVEPQKVPLEFMLLDADEKAVADEDYKVTFPNNQDLEPRTGTTKSDGTVLIQDLPPGTTCHIQFPNRFDAEWVRLRVEDMNQQ